ncbi:hypothetical protein EOS_31515 [Caballeronia mineralivorans PML1(12)]|uniref:Plasmid stabilization protein n=1 Tax=Caballeronia mineralivorans PML1(12) TaxID=908627 RepID=A0A0J1FR50_9BURK|nr:hypothetical protein [Caballeronia mineralivorans]KLU22228.1 hypothetical protein EOS_31515 [Caballeronia mineralivorans PML1(12)]
MDLKFLHEALDRLETDAGFDHDLPQAVVRAYRKRLAVFRSATSRHDLLASRSLGMTCQAGGGRCRASLIDNFALVFEIVDDDSLVTVVSINSVESEMSI